MKASLIVSAAAVAAVFGGVWWLAREPSGASTSPVAQRATDAGRTGSAREETPTPAPPARSRVDASKRPVPTDPRLALHMGAPDDALVEYVAGPDGRVILEIDDDPNSPRYRKPLREYLYAGNRVAGVTVYRHLGNQVQVIRALVTYQPDGSVDEYRETTEYRKTE